MQRIRLVRSLAIVALVIAACSSDSAATSSSTPSGSSASTSSAPPTSSALGREIHASSTPGTPTIGEQICDAQQHCMFPLTITGTYSGDLTGTSISHSAGALVGTEYAAGDTLIFTGTVVGCGTGTLVILSTGRGTTDGKGSSKWDIVDGMGSGELARVRGSGTTTLGADVATVTGHITCD